MRGFTGVLMYEESQPRFPTEKVIRQFSSKGFRKREVDQSRDMSIKMGYLYLVL